MKLYNDCFGVAITRTVAEPPAYTAIKPEDSSGDISVGNSVVPPGADWIPMRQLYNAHRL